MFEFVQVHNTGRKLLRFPIPKAPGDMTDGIRWCEIEPGKAVIMPFLSAVSAFGHPNEIDTPRLRHRSETYRRLRFQWGYHEGFDAETEADRKAHPEASNMGSWEAKRPQFKVTTLEGAYVPMILDDPERKHPIPNSDGTITPELAATGQASSEALMTLIANQASELAELKALILAQNSGGAAAVNNTDALPQAPANEDAPTTDAPKATPVTAGGKSK